MEDLKGKTLEEIKEISAKLGFAPFKAREIFRQVHQKLKTDLSEFTTLRKGEREKLENKYCISAPQPLKIQKGRGAEKVAFELEDRLVIEAVYMRYGEERGTVCVSSQVGCPVGCSFCATGKMGFKRNLTPAEILSQVYYFAKGSRVSNIVFMGMGEPFLNYNNVIAAAKILNHPLGQRIAARKIVFSTVGIVSGIKRFTLLPEQFRLAWSLAASFDGRVLAALLNYQKRTGRRVTLEYAVLGGVNDGEKQTQQLIKIARRLDCHVNLIPYNAIPASGYTSGNVTGMFRALQRAQVNVTIRKSLGSDISAACGQLAA